MNNNNKLASNSSSNTNSIKQIPPHHRIDEEETIYKKYELGRKLGQVYIICQFKIYLSFKTLNFRVALVLFMKLKIEKMIRNLQLK
jgi:hypothetical protein